MPEIHVDIDEVRRIAGVLHDAALELRLGDMTDLSPSASQAVSDALGAFHDALASSITTARSHLENAGVSVALAAGDFTATEVSVSDIAYFYTDRLP